MKKCSFILGFIMSGSLLFGQLDSNSITVTASRNNTLQPDQIVFSVDVSSDMNTTFDDILAALAGSGISATNFQNVYTNVQFVQTGRNPQPVAALDWSFTLAVAWSKMKDTIAMLTSLQKSVSQKNSALMLSFSVQGPQVSSQLQQMQTCSVPDLLADARSQAQNLASAANLFLGAVLAMSSSISTGTIGSGALFYGYSPPCALTVKFAVTR